MNAEQIRQQVLELRKTLSPQQLSVLSEAISARFMLLSGFQETKTLNLQIGMYRSLPWELDLKSLERSLRQRGCSLYYPRVIERESKEMEFVEVSEDHPTAWNIGHYGIEEPHPDRQVTRPECLDLIFVPGVAYGESGERVGMGAGYYDRFLPKASVALRVALACDFQIFPKISQLPTDQTVHWIVTEKREFQTSRVSPWLKQKGIA